MAISRIRFIERGSSHVVDWMEIGPETLVDKKVDKVCMVVEYVYRPWYFSGWST
jgi:hypothetical protein